MAILITCETAGTELPAMNFADQLVSPTSARIGGGASNLSADPAIAGAGVDECGGVLAKQLANDWGSQLIVNPFRSDLIDVGRSLKHRRLFGKLAAGLPEEQKHQLIGEIYRPYRERVEEAIERMLQQFNFMVHLSLRSFDLHHAGKLQRTDIGLLYDPARTDELDLCVTWIDELYDLFPNVRVRRNYPRRGTVDSLTKSMRQKYPEGRYLGIEVWMNRAWAGRASRRRDEALAYFADSLRITIGMPSTIAA